MAITLGDAFQNWNNDSKLPTAGATVDGGVIDMLEPNLFRNKVMIPGVTFATDVESLMVDNQFAVAFIRKLDKIKVNMCKATDDEAFRVVPTSSDGKFIAESCGSCIRADRHSARERQDRRQGAARVRELRRGQRASLSFVPYQRRRVARSDRRRRARFGEYGALHESERDRQHNRRPQGYSQSRSRPGHVAYQRRYRCGIP